MTLPTTTVVTRSEHADLVTVTFHNERMFLSVYLRLNEAGRLVRQVSDALEGVLAGYADSLRAADGEGGAR